MSIVSAIIIFCLIITLIFFITKKQPEAIKTSVDVPKYDITEELLQANNKYDILNKAEVLTSGKVNDEVISLLFEEIADDDTMIKLLDVLDTYQVKGTFFVTANECVEQEKWIKEIVSRGHNIENKSMDQKTKKEELTKEECLKDFVLSSKMIETVIKVKPTYLRCQDTIYSDSVLASAKASNHHSVVIPSSFISYQSFKSAQQAQQYADTLETGSLIAVKIKSELTDKEYPNKTKVSSGLKQVVLENENTEVDIIQNISWLLESLQNKKQIISLDQLQLLQNNYHEIAMSTPVSNKQRITKDFSSYISNNNNQQVNPISMFYTTKQAVAYTFKGLSNELLLYKILDTLDNMQAKATFFVTTKDIQEHRDLIKEISSRGHEIGNGGITSDTKVTGYLEQQICNEIYQCHQALLSLGLNTKIYMPANGNTNTIINRAVSTIRQLPGMEDYEVLGNTRAPILSKYKGKTANEIVSTYFKEGSYLSLRRGDIVYFKVDSNCISDEEIIALIVQINEQLIKNGRVRKLVDNQYQTFLTPLNYQITTIANIQNTYETTDQEGRYQQIEGLGDIYEGKVEPAIAYQSIAKHFIGNINQNEEYFNDKELSLQIDRTGVIDTKQKPVIFLTFDDWAGDPTTNKLLDVLDKHQVKGSFFIIAKNVDFQKNISNVNPNLLRAMALKGHDIGSHMYNHETLKASREEVKTSIINSYQIMHQTIGDLPSLKPYFRPPQLLITSHGLQEVMEAGYTYSISGTKSTNDYDKTSEQQILKEMEDQLLDPASKTQGTIFIMHVNDQSSYTAGAVDAFLTKNEQGEYGVKYEIAKLSDYLK